MLPRDAKEVVKRAENALHLFVMESPHFAQAEKSACPGWDKLVVV